MVIVSGKFKAAIKLGNRPAYRYEQEGGIDPTVLSKLMNGISRVHENDPRVIAVGRVLVQPEECFQEVSNDAA